MLASVAQVWGGIGVAIALLMKQSPPCEIQDDDGHGLP
jgi:hypothetical protein